MDDSLGTLLEFGLELSDARVEAIDLKSMEVLVLPDERGEGVGPLDLVLLVPSFDGVGTSPVVVTEAVNAYRRARSGKASPASRGRLALRGKAPRSEAALTTVRHRDSNEK